MPVVCVCLSPGFQRTVVIDALVAGEVNRLSSVVVDAAGKGVNVCRVLQRLGTPTFCLAQGGDNGGELMALAAAEGLELRLVPSSGRLRHCTSIVETRAATGHRVTELVEPSSPVAASCVEALTAAVREALPAASALVIAGSIAPGFPAGYQARLAAMAAACGVPVFLDLQGQPLVDAIAAGATVVKINLAEFAATFLGGRFSGGENHGILAAPELPAEILDAVAEVSRRYAATFVLTRAHNSTVLAQQGELRLVSVPPLDPARIRNTIGCGDAFLAGMLAKWLSGGGAAGTAPTLDGLEESIGFATACAQSAAQTLRPGFLEESFKSPGQRRTS